MITEPTVRYHVLQFANLVTSAIVETAPVIVIVDVGLADIPSSGTELRAYAEALTKPMSIIITYAHRDHYGDLAQFLDTDVYAETNNAAALMADPLFVEIYTGTVNSVTGTHSLAGLRFGFNNISYAETTENGHLDIPALGTPFFGDLIFNREHLFIREYAVG